MVEFNPRTSQRLTAQFKKYPIKDFKRVECFTAENGTRRLVVFAGRNNKRFLAMGKTWQACMDLMMDFLLGFRVMVAGPICFDHNEI